MQIYEDISDKFKIKNICIEVIKFLCLFLSLTLARVLDEGLCTYSCIQ
jgi:hypothetical protein